VVRIHRGPAAVIGDESHDMPFARNASGCVHMSVAVRLCGEGVVSRMIRKPEDLPAIELYDVVPTAFGAAIRHEAPLIILALRGYEGA